MKIQVKQIQLLSIVLVMLIGFLSCTNDLDITPKDDQDTLGEELFEDETAYKRVLAGIYGNLALTGTDGAGSSNIEGIDAGTSQFGRVLLYLQTLTADQMIWSYENDPGTRELQRNTWTAQNPLILGMFSRTSLTISLANNFLRETTDDKLDSRGVSQATRNEIVRYRAEARLLRAMSYYYMMDLFGKAPLGTEANAVNEVLPEANRGELFTFVYNELTEIMDDLADPGTNEYGRADKGAANMILAKIFLNANVYLNEYPEVLSNLGIGDPYAECINYCDNIINNGYYDLADSYLHNFMADNNTNSAKNEIIFPIISDGLTTQNYGPTTVMINGQVGSLEVNGEEVGVGAGGWGGALRVRKQFADLFNGSEFDTDERNTLITADRSIDIEDISNPDQGYIIQKYSNATSTGGFGIDQTFVDTDFPLFRLADVYLMYADAHILSNGSAGNQTRALELINELRARSNNFSVVNASDLTSEFIVAERSRELHWEAHRRQDLIRHGLYTGGNYNWAWKGNSSNGIGIPNYFDLFPIPSQSLSSNPNLTQNPGY